MSIQKHRPTSASALFAAVLLAYCEAGAPSAAEAGVNAWTQLGPEGGSLCALAVAPSDPSRIYAAGAFGGIATGLFRSADGGESWESTGAPVDTASCILAVDSADPLRLYAGRSARLWRSLDGGTTWTESHSGLPLLDERAKIAVDAHDPTFLLLNNFGSTYRSRDRGISWEPTPGLTDSVRSLAIDPTVAGGVFALTYHEGVLSSDDYGDHWTAASAGLPETYGPLGLTFDPHLGGVAYLFTYVGIYRTGNGGALWSLVLPVDGEQDQVQQLVVRPDSAVFVVKRMPPESIAVLRSYDGGETWETLPGPFRNEPYVGFTDLAAPSTALIAASWFGAYRSEDDGATWQGSDSGRRGATVSYLALDRQSPERTYGIDRSLGYRLLRSADRGVTWQASDVETPSGKPLVRDLLVDPNASNHLLAAVEPSGDFDLAGVASSTDGGETWSVLPGPFSCLSTRQLTIDPLESNRLFRLGTRQSPHCPLLCADYASDDAGVSWRCIDPPGPLGIVEHLAPSPFSRGVVLAIGSKGIYRSANSGVDWTQVAALPQVPGLPPYDEARFVDLEWADANTAYATNSGAGLYVSQDGGWSWQPTAGPPESLEFPWLAELTVDPFHRQTLYVSSASAIYSLEPRSVLQSRDGGVSWIPLTAGLLGWTLSGLTLDPVTPNRLYVSALGGSVLTYDVHAPEPCVPSATALCVTDGRFKLESIWRDFAGRSGVGHAVPLAADTGAFWFFDPDNLELFAKEIDGIGYNNAFWTFYGALSNVEFTLLATDTATGAQHGYFNRSTQFASRGDIESFPQEVGAVASASSSQPARVVRRARAAVARSANACVPSATTLCLAGGRFAASVTWRDFVGRRGVGTPIVLTPDTGSFWFFDAGIHELAVKVIDGRGSNNAYWVFYGSLSNVQFDLTIVDTDTGEVWTRRNPLGTFASNGDIEAFPQLP
jgi:photosystem II stability/assembly factor-like uncharacterized protein